jgi:GT2 family glycosyltransferase
VIGAVILTQGRRPVELAAAIDSLLGQQGVDVDIVVVGNGWTPANLPEGVGALALAQDLGTSAGRNAGVPAVRGDILLFLDDDAGIAPGMLAPLAARFDDPAVGAVQPRVRASDGGPPPRDWVPRLRVGDRARSSEATSVWEGAVAVRRTVFEQVGGWPAMFGRGHEGVDLAWRIMDTGRRVLYAGDVEAFHPSYPTAPYDHSLYFGVRNRIFLARRHLPLPLGAVFVAAFLLRALPVVRSATRARAALRGFRDGVRLPCGPRRRLRVNTLWRMTRAGRPPVL